MLLFDHIQSESSFIVINPPENAVSRRTGHHIMKLTLRQHTGNFLCAKEVVFILDETRCVDDHFVGLDVVDEKKLGNPEKQMDKQNKNAD